MTVAPVCLRSTKQPLAATNNRRLPPRLSLQQAHQGKCHTTPHGGHVSLPTTGLLLTVTQQSHKHWQPFGALVSVLVLALPAHWCCSKGCPEAPSRPTKEQQALQCTCAAPFGEEATAQPHHYTGQCTRALRPIAQEAPLPPRLTPAGSTSG